MKDGRSEPRRPAGGCDDTSRLRLRHRAHPVELGRIRRRIGRWASQTGVPEDVTIDLQLAVGEAVANGVEHAYGPDGGAGGDVDGTVEVEVELRDGRPPAVLVRVADRGVWRPRPQSPGFRGRGLLMIERLAQRVQVLCSPGGTEVCFEIAFPA